MVSLSNPSGLLVLGGMAALGSRKDQQNRFTDAGLTAGLSGKQVVAGSVGANSAPVLAQAVKQRDSTGLTSNLSEEAIQGLTGMAVSWLGRDGPLDSMSSWANPFAAGMVYNAGSEALNSSGIGLGNLIGNSGGSTTQTAQVQSMPTPSTTATPQMHGGGGGGTSSDVVDY